MDVGAVLEHVQVEQPAEACIGESGCPATTATTEESQPMLRQHEAVPEPVKVEQVGEACGGDSGFPAMAMTEERRQPTLQQHVHTVPVADHHEASEEPERQKPVVAKKEEVEREAADGQESTRERLKRHRREMAGRVWVPEMWGQEKLLKDWVDCAVFDRPLVPAGLLTARRALIAECCTTRPDRTSPASSAGSSPLRVRNGCS